MLDDLIAYDPQDDPDPANDLQQLVSQVEDLRQRIEEAQGRAPLSELIEEARRLHSPPEPDPFRQAAHAALSGAVFG